MNYLSWPLALGFFLAASISGAQGAAPCQLAIATNFPVTYINGHIPVVSVKIDGKDLKMMVDSGASFSSVTTAAWSELKPSPLERLSGPYGVGVAGTAQVNTAIMKDIYLGQVKIIGQVLIVTDDFLPENKGKLPADGVLGSDILQSFDVGLDLPDNRITLYLPQKCSAPEVPWPGDYAPVPITVTRNLVPTIPYGVDNQTLAGIIDTGSDISMIAQPALTREGIKPESAPANLTIEEMGVGHHEILESEEQFGSITVGAESFSNAWVDVANSPISRFNDVLIGEDYLATHRVFVSNSTETAFLGLYIPNASSKE